MEEISCTVSSLKLICLSGNATSGCGVIDVNIPCAAGVNISEVRFKNNYTASLSVKGKLAGSEAGKYITLVEYFQLMKSPHCANESQNTYKIDFTEKGVSDENITSLRFILRQPSSIWEKFSIEDIKLYKKTVQKDVIPDDEKILPQCDLSLGDIVQSLQELINQMDVIQSHHVEFDPVPFDIDGCYDINLLSYT